MPGGSATADAQAAQRIAEDAARTLYAQDRASQALGMRIERVGPGESVVSMRIQANMTNGHGLCHGGLIFALADSSFAFACNSYGASTVAASASIDFLAPGRDGDTLTATARELWRGKRSGLYEVAVTNQHGATLALFRGRSQQVAGRIAQDGPVGDSA